MSSKAVESRGKRDSMAIQRKIQFLEGKAVEMRQHLLTMIYEAKSGHPGGSLSIADILTVAGWELLQSIL